MILGAFLDPVDLVRRAPIARALHDLTPEFRLVYVDHRGHGRSGKPHEVEAYATPRRVADVVAVLDELGIERAHVLGISWGGGSASDSGSMRRNAFGPSSRSVSIRWRA